MKEQAVSARISQRGDRKINQDRCEIFTRGTITVMVLADGMGGHPKGETAAQIFIDTAYRLLKLADEDEFHRESYINDVLTTAHRNILHYGQSKHPPIYPRTTAVIVVIHNNLMQWSHMGDSRTYLFRHGRAHMRTLDHTPVEALRLSGKIEDSDSQSMASGRSGVNRCLGGKRKIQDIVITPAIRLQDKDILLMCSDGVWSQLKQAQLESTVLEEDLPLQNRISNLVEMAVASGHPHSDNATAMALCWSAENSTLESSNQNRQSGIEPSITSQADDVDLALDHLRGLIDKYQ